MYSRVAKRCIPGPCDSSRVREGSIPLCNNYKLHLSNTALRLCREKQKVFPINLTFTFRGVIGIFFGRGGGRCNQNLIALFFVDLHVMFCCFAFKQK